MNVSRGGMGFASTQAYRLHEIVWTALHYRVSQIHPSVPSSDVSWVAPTADDRLTLQTSTGPTPAYPRFIVVAIRA